ncbi:unnamed protein product, partial [Staurois parvus]
MKRQKKKKKKIQSMFLSVTKPRSLHSLYLVSQDPAFTISGLPGPCIHYIWSPRTLHSLYLVSPDPAFTISGLPGPCIYY